MRQLNLAAEIAPGSTYLSGQQDEMLSTMACSFAKISDCRSDSLTLRASSSKDATMYSISGYRQDSNMAAKPMPEYLVTPVEVITVPVLDPIPCMQKLGNAMRPDVVSELLCVFPGERGAEG